MLTSNDRLDLKFAMQAAVLEEAAYTGNVVLESYIKEEMTYEQLLNVCYNLNRDDVYMESSLLEHVAQDYILKMVYEGNVKPAKPLNSIRKNALLEQSLKDKAGALAGAAKEKITSAAKIASKKAAPAVKKAAEAVKTVAKKAGKRPGKAAAIGAAGLAAAAGAWYLYRKLRKSGAEKAEAARAAAEVAEKKAKETGDPKDAKKAVKWRARAQRYASKA
jgi:hypothetical protein